MTPAEAAAKPDGNEYGKEGSKELFQAMKAAGLVAVYGASDDLMEFEVAIRCEVGCYNEGEAYLKGWAAPERLRQRALSSSLCQGVADSCDNRGKMGRCWGKYVV